MHNMAVKRDAPKTARPLPLRWPPPLRGGGFLLLCRFECALVPPAFHGSAVGGFVAQQVAVPTYRVFRSGDNAARFTAGRNLHGLVHAEGKSVHLLPLFKMPCLLLGGTANPLIKLDRR